MSAQAAEVLRKALDRFGPNGENWVQIGFLSDTKYCAITACGETENAEALGEALDLLDSFVAPKTVDAWQDMPVRTFAQVKNLFEKAIAEAEAERAQ